MSASARFWWLSLFDQDGHCVGGVIVDVTPEDIAAGVAAFKSITGGKEVKDGSDGILGAVFACNRFGLDVHQYHTLGAEASPRMLEVLHDFPHNQLLTYEEILRRWPNHFKLQVASMTDLEKRSILEESMPSTASRSTAKWRLEK